MTGEGERRTVSVIGVGTVHAPPDTAQVSIGVSIEHPSLPEARSLVASKLAAGRGVIAAAGVSDHRVATERLNIGNWRNQSGATVHQVSTTLRVRVDDLAILDQLVSDVIDAIGSGAQLHGMDFDIVDRSELAAAARDLAWAEAVAKATQLAGLAAADLGPAIEINEGRSGGPPPRPLARMAVQAESMGAPMAIEGGELSESVQLTVTFELQ